MTMRRHQEFKQGGGKGTRIPRAFVWHQSEGKAGFVEHSGAVFGATVLLMVIVKGVTARFLFRMWNRHSFQKE